MSLRKGHFKSTSTAFFLLAGKASTQPWSWCNPLKSWANIFLKRAGVLLNPGGIRESDKAQKIQVHNNTGLKSHPRWPPCFTFGNSIWAFKYIPLPAVKADAQGMCERPQNRLLLKVKPAVGHSDFLIPQYTWIFFFFVISHFASKSFSRRHWWSKCLSLGAGLI